MRLSSVLVFLVSPLQTLLLGLSVGAQESDNCNITKIKQNPFVHKPSYTVVVHAVRGLEQTSQEAREVFSDYLTATAGQKFDPPIQFNMAPLYYSDLIHAIENDELDFLYSNPGVYSCIGTQVGATALATVVKSAFVRGRAFDLDVYGGVIAVRHDNDEINTIRDLKGKIIGAGAIVDLMGGQMQIYEMARAGLSYVNDPKQVIFTNNQYDVVEGLLDGTFDVGFIRTGQIESSTDKNGTPIDPQLFKILEPKTFVMESGELFPFLHSTDIYPQWPLAALPRVPADVQRAVQSALMDFGNYALIGQLQECSQSGNESEWCSDIERKSSSLRTPCNATDDFVQLVAEMSQKSQMTSFRTARSYFGLRSIQEEAGFLIESEDHGWHCVAPDDLYEGITCPQGYFKRNREEYNDGCKHAGLSCEDEHDCFCKPCVKAFDVDVYHLAAGEDDPHLQDSFTESYPGCEKMEICGVLKQRENVTIRIFDNMLRDGAQVTAKCAHGDQGHNAIIVKNIPGTYAYEFTISDNKVQVHVIDVFVDGKTITQSPIRVMVVEADCDAQYGAGSHRVPDSDGICVCANNTYEIGGTCLGSTAFILIIVLSVLVIIGIMLFFYLGYKKRQSDSVWHINVEELHFNEPPEIIGAGGFGVVILGQYRGTKVAVKRVLPPSKLSKGQSGSLNSGQSDDTGSAEIMEDRSNLIEEKKAMIKLKKGAKGRVKFGDTTTTDLESQQTVSHSGSTQRRGSISGSNNDWDRLMTNHHSDHDVLRLLESATSSDHGSGPLFDGSASKSVLLLRYLPMWLRFDSHSRRVSEFVNEMRMLSRLRHPCITTVMGAVVSSAIDPMLVMEYMEYGSLHDLLHNETMTPGGEIILQVARDIVQGIQFLHASKPPILHGDLKANNILVDSRFRAKVADFGFSHFKCSKQRNVLRGTPFYMAPEYLRRRSEYTTACDIYSLAMIIYEIYARAGPFEGEDPRKMLPKICHPRLNKRPPIPDSCPPKMVDLMKKCWSANAFFRPSAKDIDYVLVEMSSTDTEPLETAKGRLRDNLKRKPTSLYDVFPKHIADALNAGKKVEAESHEIVTVLFSDIVGFTTISEQFSPLKVSDMLDRLYQEFDKLADKHGVFKVETIGDAYMGVTNLDGSKYDTHVKQIAEYAQDAIQVASQILIDVEDPSMGHVQIRVGFHSGPVVSNVIGSLNPRYGLFGDTVNTASRMESNSMPGKIHCSFASAQLLQTQAPDIPLTLRGMIKIKGKGKMKTFWVGGDDLVNKHSSIDPVSEQCPEEMISNKMHDRVLDDDPSISDLAVESMTPKTSLDTGRDHFIGVHAQNESCPVAIRMDGSMEETGVDIC